MLTRFHPRALDAIHDYNKSKFIADITAGISVGIVALPLAMAFAIASGLTPAAGLTTAIIAGFLISLLGGSKVQIGGPAGAFIVVVYAIVQQYGLGNLLLATMLAGVFMFLLGLFGLGALVRHIPVSIVIGFTNGIAALIALSQLNDFLGLNIENLPAEFFSKTKAIGLALPHIHLATLAVGLFSLTLLIIWPRIARHLPFGFQKIPGSMVALLFGTLLAQWPELHVATIGSRFGDIPSQLPTPTFPQFTWHSLAAIIQPALTIAVLGAIESLLCARIADSMINDRHDPNQELMAQGIANFASPLFGGFCATGTIARTVTNINSGASSPVSGMVHALSILLIMAVAAPFAKLIPLPTLAAVLLYVAWNMGEWDEFRRLQHFTGNYRTILLSTFILTVVVDLTVAMEVGLLLACVFFITRVSSLTHLKKVELPDHLKTKTDQIEAWSIHGSLFFGSIAKIESLLDPHKIQPDLLILDLSSLLNMDTTGLEALETLQHQLHHQGACLIICGAGIQPNSLIHRSGFYQHLGAEFLLPDLPSAWQSADHWLKNTHADHQEDSAEAHSHNV
ncbi:SulP family inorganic anion transporter [Janthinobacterium sp. B9-8]|uniref:SulP family inorganic anion transporter n=1 Tax=Janthinobacterium sp. B9-8 TaxID=1236179 RepID=UPI00061D1732|nr:SulP family inorganic anion transporter [Janthinobacterium sp. B9-8]AMC33622.1 sulfate transporter [Janthinobacterium sp. B9-8]